MIEISTDRSRLNISLIQHYLANESYWAKDRSMDVVKKSIENSLCFGVYDEQGGQIGFARVVTDFAVFAWVMDVFIITSEQGKGYGKKLLDAIIHHPELQTLKRWGLATQDAHSLYQQFGFIPLKNPQNMMEFTRMV